MKKIYTRILVLTLAILALFLCAACTQQGDDGDETTHTHTPVADWSVNRKQHWKSCTDDNTPLEVADHTLDANVCTVCGAKVIHNENGTTNVYQYNAQGDIILRITYDKNGNAHRYKRENSYDPQGILIAHREYLGEELRQEVEYAYRNTNRYIAKQIDYSAGGKHFVERNGFGDVVKDLTYAKDGTLKKEITYEIVYDENGNKLSSICYQDGTPATETVYSMTTVDGVVVTYISAVTNHHSDGGKVIQKYDSNSNLTEEQVYGANGSLAHTYTYIYNYKEDGTLANVQKCEGDIVWEEKMYDTFEGKTFLWIHAVYNEAGDLVSLTEYNERGEVVTN